MMPIPHIYVAAPYRAKTPQAVEANIAAARHVGQLMVRRGWHPVLPTVNTGMMDRDYPGMRPDQWWLDATAGLMLRCDAVVLTPGWEYSEGCRSEIRLAEKHGIQVWHPHEVPEGGFFTSSRGESLRALFQSTMAG